MRPVENIKDGLSVQESWEMLSSRAEAIVGEGDRVVWIGRVRWRHRRTLRELDTPKIDVWTLWQGRAIRYFEMVDSASYGRATGLLDPAPQQA
jgi:ketosteroid isomerase-like protein